MLKTEKSTDFNVRDFGAIGNGSDLDTLAIQRTLDACAASASGSVGGRVLVPAGNFLTGTLRISSHTELHLCAGATILGTCIKADYQCVHGSNGWCGNSGAIGFNYDEHLIVATDAKHVSITGQGTIDGNARAIMTVKHAKGHMTFKDWRPGPLVAFVRCEDVTMRDVSLVDSPSFSIWPVGCERVKLTGLRLWNNRLVPNADGIHVSCTSDVRISDCSIDAGDDCLCFYTMPYWLKNTRPCENVVVTNCTLRTRCCGVRIGYVGDGPLRNFAFNNLVMHGTQTGIDMLVSKHTYWQLDCEEPTQHGPSIENVSFNNIVMDTQKAIYLWTDKNATAPAGIRNLSISNLVAATTHTCFVCGNANLPIENVRFDNIQLTIRGEVDDRYVTAAVPEGTSCWGTPGIPHAWFIRHGKHITLNNVRVQWGDITGPWQSVVRAVNVTDLDIQNLVAKPVAGAIVHGTNLINASLRNCRAQAGTFLQLDGPQTADITLTQNDTHHAEKVVSLAADVPADVVK